MSWFNKLFEHELELLHRTSKKVSSAFRKPNKNKNIDHSSKFEDQGSSQAPSSRRIKAQVKNQAKTRTKASSRNLASGKPPTGKTSHQSTHSSSETAPSETIPAVTIPKRLRPSLGKKLKPFFQSSLGFLASAIIHLGLVLWMLSLAAQNPEPEKEEPFVFSISLKKTKAPPTKAEKPADQNSTKVTPQKQVPPKEEPKPVIQPDPIVEIPPTSEPQSKSQESTPDLKVPKIGENRSINKKSIGLSSGGSTSSKLPKGRGNPFEGRTGVGKEASIGAYGGSGATEDAVHRSLAWLARHQDKDGKWDSDGYAKHCTSFRSCDLPGLPQYNIGVTSLALLAFLGAGYTPQEESIYQSNVKRGLRYLLLNQNDHGAINTSEGSKYLFYNHALATLVLIEAAGKDRDPKYYVPAKRALKFSTYHQQNGGGWDYETTETGRNDLSITGWQIMAFKAGESIGIPIPNRTQKRIKEYLERAVLTNGSGIYADRGDRAGHKGVNMAAVGLMSRLYMGSTPSSVKSFAAAKRILRNPPHPKRMKPWKDTYQSHYYWYTATLAMFHFGGDEWDRWNFMLKENLLTHQVRGGHQDGSWTPEKSCWVDTYGGRIATTALMALTFEVYYRYPPLHAYK